MITVAICDDEPYFLVHLRKSVEHYFFIQKQEIQIFEFDNGESLLSSGQNFDMILMDLKLPGKNGLEIIQQLRREKCRCQVIFITSYQEYALQAFQVDAVHYLLKPITDENLYQALDRTIERMGKTDSKTLTITKGACTEIVFIKDILYCEVMDHRLYIHTKDTTYNYLGTLDELHKKLDSRFFRAGRALIVNLKYIRRVTKTEVLLSDGTVLALPRGAYEPLNRAIIQHT